MYLWRAVNCARYSSVCLGKDSLDDNGCCQHIQGCSRLDDQDSPQTRARPKLPNILHCLKHGSRLGWLIDPDERSVLVYPPGQQPELLQERGRTTRSRPSSTAAANGEGFVWMVEVRGEVS